MAALIPPWYIQNPFSDESRPGLFDVAVGPLDLPVKAREGGIEYETSICTVPYGYEVLCQTDSGSGAPVAKTFNDTTSTIVSKPFVVVASTVCGTIGRSEEQSTRMVLDKLHAGEQLVVERIFSESTFGEDPGLANNPNAATLPPAGSVNQAISELEAWLYAQYGPRGILHMPISTATYAISNYHLRWDNGWYTAAGTRVSFGNYAGTLPDGSPPTGDTTIYITGQMAVWRTPDSEIQLSPYDASVDKVTNQVRRFAEREYVLSFDCYVAGVDTTLASP